MPPLPSPPPRLQSTNLSGRTHLYLLVGFNRWSHVRKFGPLEMSHPTAAGLHWKVGVGVAVACMCLGHWR